MVMSLLSVASGEHHTCNGHCARCRWPFMLWMSTTLRTVHPIGPNGCSSAVRSSKSSVICGVKSRRPRCRRPFLRANATASARRNTFNRFRPSLPASTASWLTAKGHGAVERNLEGLGPHFTDRLARFSDQLVRQATERKQRHVQPIGRGQLTAKCMGCLHYRRHSVNLRGSLRIGEDRNKQLTGLATCTQRHLEIEQIMNML